MKRTLLLALLVVALFAMPAAASVQNVKVSGDIETTWVVRDQFDLGHQTMSNQFYQNFLMTQTRLRVDANLTDKVDATIALINERAWDQEQGDDLDMDINLAYVTLKEMLYSPLTVVIGRQNFAFGNSFVIDSAGPNNTTAAGGLNNVAEDLTKRTAVDAVRMILDYNPLTIDIIAAKLDADNLTGRETAGAGQDDDLDLFGVNGNYSLGDDLNTVVEGYFWAKIDQRVKDAASSTGAKADTVYMPGFRVAADVLDGLSLSSEFAWQFGNRTTTAGTFDNVKRSAFGAQVIGNYALPFEKTKEWSPVLTTAYTFVSGDSNPAEAGNVVGGDGTDTYEAWDPMLENQAGGKIYNAMLALSNAHIGYIAGTVKPLEDITAKVEWTGIWFHKEDAETTSGGGIGAETVMQPDGNTLSLVTTTDMKIGDEYDLSLIYDYTEDVQFKGSMGWFVPGAAVTSDNDQIASQIMLSTMVAF